MSNLIILAITLLVNNAIWVYLFRWFLKSRDVAEKDRIRELTIAMKSKDVVEYNESLPNDAPLPEETDHELLELNDESIPDQTIIKALKRAHNDDKQNKN